MKKWKKIAAVLLIGSQIAGTLLVYGTTAKASAEEIGRESELEILSPEAGMYSEDENDTEDSNDMEITLNQEGDISLLHETSLDLSAISFQVSDIRNPSKASTFNGADGKQAVILFGGVVSCGKTITSLNALAGIVPAVDMSQLNIYVFDIKGASREDILSQWDNYLPSLDDFPEQIIVNSIDNDSEYYNLYRQCCATVSGGSFTMPLIIYKGADGVVYEYTTGRTTLEAIAENVEKGGLKVDIDTNARKQVLKVTGQARYGEAYKILDVLNQERAKAGVSALVMDEDLLEAAMLRTAECSLYWSDDRPDGTSEKNASSKIMEVVYLGGYYTDAEEAMEKLMGSEWDRENVILNGYYDSVGIGCFEAGGYCIMELYFGRGSGTVGERKSDQEATYAINAATYLVTPSLEEASGTFKVGETKQLRIGVTRGSNIIYIIDADSYDWGSNSAAATVSSDGVITALSAGTAIITGKNKANSSKVLTYTLTVSDVKDGDSSEEETPTDTPPNNSAEQQVRDFVSRMYTVALGRAAEEAGLNDWTNRLLTHETDGAGIANGFIMSDEFKNKKVSDEAYVDILYRTFFDREADAGGRSDWLEKLANGNSRDFVLAGFVNSVEFGNLCNRYGIVRGEMQTNETAIGSGVRQFVERCYNKVLGRDGETAGIEDWTSRIARGEQTPESVAKLFFFSEEYANKNTGNEEFVETLYQTFMGRASDPAGKSDWVGRLSGGTSREEVLEGFSRSEEFAGILRSFGL